MKIFWATLALSPAICAIFATFLIAIDRGFNSFGFIKFFEALFASVFASYLLVLVFWKLLILLVVFAGLYSLAVVALPKYFTQPSLLFQYMAYASSSVIISLLVYVLGFDLLVTFDMPWFWMLGITLPTAIFISLLTTWIFEPYNKFIKPRSAQKGMWAPLDAQKDARRL